MPAKPSGMEPPAVPVAKTPPVKATPVQVAVYFERRTVVAEVARFPLAAEVLSDVTAVGDSVALPIDLPPLPPSAEPPASSATTSATHGAGPRFAARE